MKLTCAIICCASLAFAAHAQEVGRHRSKPVEGHRPGCPTSSPLEKRVRIYECRMNCGLLYYPPPEYPALARAAKVSGEVIVQIVVSKSGHVVAARVISGHPLLIKAALDAGCRVLYRPLKVSGRAVAFRTTIRYNFNLSAPPPNNGLHPTDDTLLLKFNQSRGAAGDAGR